MACGHDSTPAPLAARARESLSRRTGFELKAFGATGFIDGYRDLGRF